VTHEEEVTAFCKRVFSGRDLLQLMDEEGVGVGATMQIVDEAETRSRNTPRIYRSLDGIQPVLDYIATLGDMYHWNEWIIKKLEEEFGVG